MGSLAPGKQHATGIFQSVPEDASRVRSEAAPGEGTAPDGGAHSVRYGTWIPVTPLGERNEAQRQLCFLKTTLWGGPGAWRDPRRLCARTPLPRALTPTRDKAHFSNCKVAKGTHVPFEIPSAPGLRAVAAPDRPGSPRLGEPGVAAERTECPHRPVHPVAAG